MIIRPKSVICHNCAGMTIGGDTTKIITRTAERVRKQQEIHKGDFVPPHVYDKSSKKMIPNTDFMRLYPNQAPQYYNSDEKRKLKIKEK